MRVIDEYDVALPSRDEATLRAGVTVLAARIRRRRRVRRTAARVTVVAVVAVLATSTLPTRQAALRTRPGVVPADAPTTTVGTMPPRVETAGIAGGVVAGASSAPVTESPSVAPTHDIPRSVDDASPAHVVFKGDFGVYEMRADGTGRRQVPGISGETPALSPDGRRVAYSEFVIPGRARIVVHDLATGEQRIAVDESDAIAREPAWSRDGRLLAVTLTPWGSGAAGREVSVVLADVEKQRTWTVTSGSQPQWTPDGRILFRRDNRLWVMATDGSDVTVVPNSDDLSHASWSPDGRWIVALERTGGRLVVVRPDGSERHVLPAEGTGPAWFPDGSRVAYSTNDGLWSVRPDGSDRRRLTDRSGDREPSLAAA